MAEGNTGNFFRNLFSGVLRKKTGLQVGEIRSRAKIGDMLEYQRSSNTHYALYLGDGKVMHIDAEDSRASEAQVEERTVEELFGGCKVRIKGHENVAQSVFKLSPRSEQEIVAAAKSFKNRVVPYEFDFRNSEYYCSLWRYGKGFSTKAAQQVTRPDGMYVGRQEAESMGAICFDMAGYTMYKELAKNQEGHQ